SVGSDGVFRAQNRGQYLTRPLTGQFARLNDWLAMHEEALFDALGESLILFGEWVAAVHSLEYPGLPDYFLAFDVYDRREKKFWSTARRDALVAELGLHHIHVIGSGEYQLGAIEQLLRSATSSYRHGACEGVYLRQEDNNWLIARAKLVHPDFVQNIGEHWRSRTLRWNVVRPELPLVVPCHTSDGAGC
ncbi:MAG: RNA ligase family protein, partial [Sulfuricella sp.]|nr:RNA ligase family protein [Sulfuricella sp.]